VAVALQKLLASGNPERADRMMAALLQMTKFDIAALQAAYDGL